MRFLIIIITALSLGLTVSSFFITGSDAWKIGICGHMLATILDQCIKS